MFLVRSPGWTAGERRLKNDMQGRDWSHITRKLAFSSLPFLVCGVAIWGLFLRPFVVDLQGWAWIPRLSFGIETPAPTPQLTRTLAHSKKTRHHRVARLQKDSLHTLFAKPQILGRVAHPVSPVREDNERGKLMKIHRHFTSRLMVVMTSAALPTLPVSSRNNIPVESIPKAIVQGNPRGKTDSVLTQRALAKTAPRSQPLSEPQVKSQAKKVNRAPAFAKPVGGEPTIKDIAQSVKSGQEWNRLVPPESRPENYMPTRKTDEGHESLDLAMDYNKVGESLDQETFGRVQGTLGLLDPNSASPEAPVKDFSELASHFGIQEKAEYPKDSVVTTQASSENTLNVSVATQTHVTTHNVPSPPVSGPVPAPVPHPETQAVPPPVVATHARRETEAPPAPLPPAPPSPPAPDQGIDVSSVGEDHCKGDDIEFFEAFRPDVPVYGAHSEMLSKEGAEETGLRGLKLSSGLDDRWATLSWVDQGPVPQGCKTSRLPVPLLSVNAVGLLERHTGIHQELRTGILFGKVAKGWRVEFAGRADAPVYLTTNDAHPQIRETISQDEDSYFALLNVEPGAHLTYLSSNGRSGAVAFPILAGTASYLDLTRWEEKTFSGRVQTGLQLRNEKSQRIRPEDDEGNVLIQVLGQASAVGTVRANGSFEFRRVLTFGSYPFYVETDQDYGVTHRYRVLPSRMKDVRLKRYSAHSIQKSLKATASSVGSGMVIASLPRLVEQSSDYDLLPNIHAMLTAISSEPETYTLSPGGIYEPHGPLNQHESEFIGVSVPEGPNLVQVLNGRKELVWAEAAMVSSDVVSVIGD